MRGWRCLLAGALPADLAWGPLEEHRDSCLRCQADDARDRALLRSLRAWGEEVLPAPASLQVRVLARLGEQDAADPRRALVARAATRYAAAAGLASAALVALLAGLARRHSRALG
jgi:hypothetical protein